MSVQHTTKLTCEMCGRSVTWPSYTSATGARRAAKEMFGWRRDKLGRDVCGKHPRLSPQKKTKEK
jgi:hypothetical protein